MTQTVLAKPKRKTAADYEDAFAQLLAEMERTEQHMDTERAEIEQLKIETLVIEARTALNLSRLEEQVNGLSKTT